MNGQNQIALVLVEDIVDQPMAEQNEQPIIGENTQHLDETNDPSRNDRIQNWKQGSPASGSFDSAVGSSVESSIGSSSQEYQTEAFQTFEETVYMTRTVDQTQFNDTRIEPPVDESVRPGKRPKITDEQVCIQCYVSKVLSCAS